MQRAEVGRIGEDIAATYLEARGWRLVDRNVRWREGEIDIVASRAGVLAFVETKGRGYRSRGVTYFAAGAAGAP